MIANLIDRKDILALRSVCRDLSRAVDDPFLDKFFSKRRHLITPYSLECLVAISKDERLRRKLRQLESVIGEMSVSTVSFDWITLFDDEDRPTTQ